MEYGSLQVPRFSGMGGHDPQIIDKGVHNIFCPNNVVGVINFVWYFDKELKC